MKIRKANINDIDAVAGIYSQIHTEEENGRVTIGWRRDVYPTVKTAEDALSRNDLFVMEDDTKVVGAAVINKIQVDVYSKAKWEFEADDNEVMVLHTLVITPSVSGRGYGKAFVAYYEQYAKDNGCRYLRIDTNEKNTGARALYKKLGYKEIDVLPCVFNGLKNVNMVLLEKKTEF